MKVTYLGSNKNMFVHGFDFSKSKTIEVPEENKTAIKKFIGSRYFHADCEENYVAPMFYVRDIKKVMTGGRAATVRENINGPGFQTESEAIAWIGHHGKLDVTHYVFQCDDDILRVPVEKETVSVFGVFKLKADGEPSLKPAKTFDSKEEAEEWMDETGKTFDDHVILGK